MEAIVKSLGCMILLIGGCAQPGGDGASSSPIEIDPSLIKYAYSADQNRWENLDKKTTLVPLGNPNMKFENRTSVSNSKDSVPYASTYEPIGVGTIQLKSKVVPTEKLQNVYGLPKHGAKLEQSEVQKDSFLYKADDQFSVIKRVKSEKKKDASNADNEQEAPFIKKNYKTLRPLVIDHTSFEDDTIVFGIDSLIKEKASLKYCSGGLISFLGYKGYFLKAETDSAQLVLQQLLFKDVGFCKLKFLCASWGSLGAGGTLNSTVFSPFIFLGLKHSITSSMNVSLETSISNHMVFSVCGLSYKKGNNAIAMEIQQSLSVQKESRTYVVSFGYER
jgi:hypothetical protein